MKRKKLKKTSKKIAPKPCFKRSEFFARSFNKKFSVVKEKILKIVPWAKVTAIGGTVIPGALTKGDVDLLVRLEKDQFLKSIKLLNTIFEKNNTQLWEDHFAIFKDEVLFDEKIDILVTAIGSKSDRRHRATELLKSDKKLLKEYNQIKSEFPDPESSEYKIEKRRFYDKLEQILNS